MFGANPGAIFSSTLAAVRSGELNTADGLLLFNRMYSADPAGTKTSTLNAIAAGMLTSAEGTALFNAIGIPSIVAKTANVTANLTTSSNTTAADIAKSALTQSSSIVTVTSTLVPNQDIALGILSYSKAEVSAVYNAIATNTGNTKVGVDQAVANLSVVNTSLTSIANLLSSINAIETSSNVMLYDIKLALLGTLNVRSEHRTGALSTFERGGAYKGGLALVGEKGPELINFNRPGWVSTADQTSEILNNASAGLWSSSAQMAAQIIQDLQGQYRQPNFAPISINLPNQNNNADQLAELKKQTEELKAQSEALKKQQEALTVLINDAREASANAQKERKKQSDSLDSLEQKARLSA
jgi:hypothetical protein